MEIQIPITVSDVNAMWAFLHGLGFQFEETLTSAGAQRMPTKTYIDSQGNFVCQVDIRVHDTFNAGLMYHVFTKAHSIEPVLGHVVPDGRSHQINFLNGDNMRAYIEFTDDLMRRAGVTGLKT